MALKSSQNTKDGKTANPKKVPPSDLKYGQVVKYREGNEVTDVKKRVVFGNEEEVLSALKLAGNSISTSYILIKLF
jgi:hypothetical protein